MAEWSKAVVSGTILFGGVGSNPTPCIFFSPSPSDFHQFSPRVSRSKRVAAFYTLLLPLSPETVWPSGLRRVTRNHFSSGGVGSNPAAVVFSFFLFLRLKCSFSSLYTADSVAEWSKAVDLKSISLWERRFEPCHCRFLLLSSLLLSFPFSSDSPRLPYVPVPACLVGRFISNFIA